MLYYIYIWYTLNIPELYNKLVSLWQGFFRFLIIMLNQVICLTHYWTKNFLFMQYSFMRKRQARTRFYCMSKKSCPIFSGLKIKLDKTSWTIKHKYVQKCPDVRMMSIWASIVYLLYCPRSLDPFYIVRYTIQNGQTLRGQTACVCALSQV